MVCAMSTQIEGCTCKGAPTNAKCDGGSCDPAGVCRVSCSLISEQQANGEISAL
eukprot:gene6712-16522_t